MYVDFNVFARWIARKQHCTVKKGRWIAREILENRRKRAGNAHFKGFLPPKVLKDDEAVFLLVNSGVSRVLKYGECSKWGKVQRIL